MTGPAFSFVIVGRASSDEIEAALRGRCANERPPRLGNLAQSARFPHFHKPLIVNLLRGHFYRGKEGDISIER